VSEPIQALARLLTEAGAEPDIRATAKGVLQQNGELIEMLARRNADLASLQRDNDRLRKALEELADHAAHQARSAAMAAARSRDAALYDEAACGTSAAGAYREMEAAARAALNGSPDAR
jgi:hypothetical protein